MFPTVEISNYSTHCLGFHVSCFPHPSPVQYQHRHVYNLKFRTRTRGLGEGIANRILQGKIRTLLLQVFRPFSQFVLSTVEKSEKRYRILMFLFYGFKSTCQSLLHISLVIRTRQVLFSLVRGCSLLILRWKMNLHRTGFP